MYLIISGSSITCACLLQREEDILLRDELEVDSRTHSQFKLWYTLDHPPPGESSTVH